MKNKIFALALSVATLSIACLIASPAWSAGQSGRNQTHQQKRIANGVRSGELTRHELGRLMHEQRQIRRFAHQARADGHIDKWERRKLTNMRQQANKHIYKAKHNRAAYDPHRCASQRPNSRHHKRGHGVPMINYGAFNGTIVQPGISVAWNINLK